MQSGRHRRLHYRRAQTSDPVLADCLDRVLANLSAEHTEIRIALLGRFHAIEHDHI
ncbi:hypothetical protein [Streptomyces zaomyceticus]|uniref:hypothetical protein n=1 Tax=Streptomyces zaomyceticus TaxID=68286 RepID=UPI0036CC5D83